MNIIKGFSEHINQKHIAQIANFANKTGDIQRKTSDQTENRDQSEMSVLSQLMAKSSRELTAELQPRSDVVAEAKQTIENLVISDQAVDVILTGMANN